MSQEPKVCAEAKSRTRQNEQRSLVATGGEARRLRLYGDVGDWVCVWSKQQSVRAARVVSVQSGTKVKGRR